MPGAGSYVYEAEGKCKTHNDDKTVVLCQDSLVSKTGFVVLFKQYFLLALKIYQNSE